MGATFARLKNWTLDLENLTNEDLNAEINNILDNLTPTGVDDHSASLGAFRTQTTPGGTGTESLPTSLAGELERLRYVLSRLIGGTYWYDAPPISLTEANTIVSLGNQIPSNRLVSGRTRSASDAFPIFLQPHGTNATVTLKGLTTAFVARIDGTAYTISTDVALTGLSLAPSSNNTCTTNDAALVTDKYAGELDATIPTITVTSMGTEITALVGKWVAFKHGATEYFTAFVKSTTQLTNAKRGFFFDSADSPVVRIGLSNSVTITLLKMHWVFLQTVGTLTSTQNNPIWAFDQPTSPASGDYWFDLDNLTWKKYNGSSWEAANAILIGVAVTDTSGCKVARSFEFFAPYKILNTITLEKIDNNTIRSTARRAIFDVAGTTYRWDHDFVTWDTTNDLAGGVTDAVSTTYYVYVSENGDTYLDTEKPYDRRHDLLGKYHPYHNWRAVGQVSNDGSSNFGTPTNYGSIQTDDLADLAATTVKLAESVFSGLTVATAASGDYLAISDISDSGNKKKALVSDLFTLVTSSEVWVVGTGSSGHGSPNTKIRYFDVANVNTGTAISYTASSVNGDIFTINESGVYGIEFFDAASGGASNLGISVNSNQGSTSIQSITAAHRRAYAQSAAAGIVTGVNTILALNAGDVVRAHTDGTQNANTFLSFRITLIRKL